MSRKTIVDLTDAVGTFVSKTNQISDHIGDLDDLDSSFKAYDSDFGRTHDSNLVRAINKVGIDIDSINNVLFGSPPGNITVKGFIGDSAVFNRLRVGKLTSDSAFIDSAIIDNLSVTGTLFAESASFSQLYVNHINVESGGHLFIDSATVEHLNVTHATMDSATFNRVTTNFLDADSAHIDSAHITELHVTNFNIDSTYDLDTLKLFTVKDEGGTAIISGYMLSTTDSAGVA